MSFKRELKNFGAEGLSLGSRDRLFCSNRFMDDSGYELRRSPNRGKDEIEIIMHAISRREEGVAIDFSIKIADLLAEKAKKFNSNNKRRITVHQLKEVFCSGVDDYSPNEANYSNTEWAIARVNMYLRIVSGELKKLAENLDNTQRVSYNKFVEITANWIPSKEDFSAAKDAVKQHDLHFAFSSVEELYLNYQPANLPY